MPQVDLVVRGGTIVDGTGAEPFVGDVAISDGRMSPSAPSPIRAARRSTPPA